MLILPPYYPQKLSLLPVIFLAGPIQGAPEWHQRAARKILKSGVPCHIACPKKGIVDHYSPKDCLFDSAPQAQYAWETSFLNHAAQNGVILFWLAKEARHTCARSYGQTTRWELAEWKERAMNRQANLVLGIEDGWTGEKYMRFRLEQDLPDLDIHSTLGGTVKEALSIIGVQNTPPVRLLASSNS